MPAKAKKKILIVEDERPLSAALELKLNSVGFSTMVARDGEEALSMLDGKDAPDLILTDLMMPKKDGFSLLEDLKARGVASPVFVMSNLGQEEDKKRALDLGAKEYIIKSNTPLADIVVKITSFFSK